jgi:hypothetical protein
MVGLAVLAHVLVWGTVVEYRNSAYLCVHCGASSRLRHFFVIGLAVADQHEHHPRENALSVQLAGQGCNHRFAPVSLSFASCSIRHWPPCEFRRLPFPLDDLVAALSTVATTNSALARDSLRYAVLGDEDHGRSEWIQAKEFSQLVQFVSTNQVSYTERALPGGSYDIQVRVEKRSAPRNSRDGSE